MNLKVALVAGLFLIFCGAAASPVYSQNKTILQLADEYSRTLGNFQARKSRMSIESLMRKGKAVAERLDELESLSEAEYALLEKKMKGFVVNREEVLVIEPDLEFFARLSGTRGTRADTAFFTVMREIKPDNVFRAYIEMQTDVTGCTNYGDGVLTSLYGKALQFKRAYPNAYAGEIDEEINEIPEEFITDDICACGEREKVFREFRLFIRTFPKDKNTPEIKKNLATLQKRKDAGFNCRSG
ncbi:MAG TPA: hypothetical protein VF604_00700 [Pyrinomonadaceae bacterium]|jgi:hypothetical protein